MIPKRAIEEYLTRDLDDLRPYKNLTDAQIEEERLHLPIRPPVWGRLKREQKVGLLLGAKHKRIAYWYDCGTGKTFLSLALIRYLQMSGDARRFIVLVPYNVVLGEWGDEIKRHCPELDYVTLEDSSAAKWDAFQASDAPVVIATYPGVLRMLSDKVKLAGKKKAQLVINQDSLEIFASAFDGVIFDESIFTGSYSTDTFRICRRLTRDAKAVFALCATPFGRDPTPLWTQMFLVDRGESLGKTLGIFRASLFKEVRNYFSMAPDYKFIPANKKILHRMIAHRSLAWPADQSSLPPVTEIVKYVTLPASAAVYYQEARAMVKTQRSRQSIEQSFLRMRQISSGFIGFTDEDAIHAQIEFDPNPKLDLLISLVESVYQAHKVLILIDFIYSGIMVCRRLDKLRIKYARIIGGLADVDKERDRFKNDSDCNVLVMSTAGAFGANLQIAKYGFFFESNPSAIKRSQMERRWERQGSGHTRVFRYDLLVRGTVDESIRDFHKTGKNLLECVLDGSYKL